MSRQVRPLRVNPDILFERKRALKYALGLGLLQEVFRDLTDAYISFERTHQDQELGPSYGVLLAALQDIIKNYCYSQIHLLHVIGADIPSGLRKTLESRDGNVTNRMDQCHVHYSSDSLMKRVEEEYGEGSVDFDEEIDEGLEEQVTCGSCSEYINKYTLRVEDGKLVGYSPADYKRGRHTFSDGKTHYFSIKDERTRCGIGTEPKVKEKILSAEQRLRIVVDTVRESYLTAKIIRDELFGQISRLYETEFDGISLRQIALSGRAESQSSSLYNFAHLLDNLFKKWNPSLAHKGAKRIKIAEGRVESFNSACVLMGLGDASPNYTGIKEAIPSVFKSYDRMLLYRGIAG